MILSPSSSKLSLSAYVSTMSSSYSTLTTYEAPDSSPTILSPIVKSPVTLESSRVFVSEFQILTLPVTPDVEPVIVSLKMNVPEPLFSFPPPSIDTVGVKTYPEPPPLNPADAKETHLYLTYCSCHRNYTECICCVEHQQLHQSNSFHQYHY